MDVLENKTGIATQFPEILFPIKMVISPNFHFCLNAHLNFPLVFWVLTSSPN